MVYLLHRVRRSIISLQKYSLALFTFKRNSTLSWERPCSKGFVTLVCNPFGRIQFTTLVCLEVVHYNTSYTLVILCFFLDWTSNTTHKFVKLYLDKFLVQILISTTHPMMDIFFSFILFSLNFLTWELMEIGETLLNFVLGVPFVALMWSFFWFILIKLQSSMCGSLLFVL